MIKKARNEYPVNSDLAIHKLLAFCTTYCMKRAFSKLVSSSPKTDSFFKILRMSFVLRCLVSIYAWSTVVDLPTTVARKYAYTDDLAIMHDDGD